MTPGRNNDMLISGALESDLTLDWCKRVQTGQILLRDIRKHTHTRTRSLACQSVQHTSMHKSYLSACPGPHPLGLPVFLKGPRVIPTLCCSCRESCEAGGSDGKDTLTSINRGEEEG